MTTYHLQVEVGDANLQFLKEEQYKLCIAKETNNEYTIIWRGANFDAINHFRWTDEYQVFYVRRFLADSIFESKAFGMGVAFGQSVEILPNGLVDYPKGDPSPDGQITVINHRGGSLNVALKSRINGDWKTCYVAPYLVENENVVTLSPVNKVRVWFQQNVQTGMMISEAKGRSLLCDFTQVKDEGEDISGLVARYDGEEGAGKWAILEGKEPDHLS